MRSKSTVRALVALGLVAAALAAPDVLHRSRPAEAVTLVEDPERNSPTATGWFYYFGISPSQMNTFLGTTRRIVNMEVSSVVSGVPYFDVTMVSNSGTYARTGKGWAYNQTSTQLATLDNTNRFLDLERYTTPSGTRYAVSYIANTGVAQKTWGYFLGSSTATISTLLGSTRRLIDLQGNSSTSFHGIWISNSGVDLRAWKRYYGMTSSALATALASGGTSAGHRVLSFERRGSVFDVITVAPKGGERWYYYYSQSATSVGNLLSQLGTRLYQLKRTTSNTFDILMINNLSGESLRVRNMFAGGHNGSNNWGFYIKRVGGSTVATLQPDRQFEPASMIKVLHHLAFHRQDAGSDGVDLGTRINFYKNPDGSPENEGDGPNTCPDYTESATTAVRTSARQVDYGMMWDSDNRHTRAMTLRFGLAGLNGLASTLGMTNTLLQQDRIGCGTMNDKRNFLTLRDAGILYEKVRNGTALNSAFRPQFEDLMINGTAGSLNTIIDQEAASLGDVTAEEKAAFKAATRKIAKGGSYNTCTIPVAACSATYFTRTDGGMVTLPAKTAGGVVTPVDYVYGRYFEGTCTGSCSIINTIGNNTSGLFGEMFRSAVRSALLNW